MNVSASPTAGVAVPASGQAETKHQKFVRLADARVERTLDDMRLIGQLKSKSYEHTAAEAQTIVNVLVNGVHDIAKIFSVPFNAKVGKAGSIGEASIFENRSLKAPVETSKVKIQIAKALDHLKNNEIAAVREILTDLL